MAQQVKDLIPGPRISACHGHGQKKKKKNPQQVYKSEEIRLISNIATNRQ